MNKIKRFLYIINLEYRCKRAFFAPYDLRPPTKEGKWIWDDHTFENAENHLTQHGPKYSLSYNNWFKRIRSWLAT